MRIDKVYNNNVVQVIDDKGQEVIVMGRGLGFQKKVGEAINPDLIERTFVPQETALEKEWHQVYGKLSDQELSLVLTVIDRAETGLGQTFEASFYIALADHLHYAIERTREGLSLKNPLAWEVRKFYPQEYQLGLEALDVVAESLGVRLDEDEAASLALHFVNAQKDSGLVTKNLQISQLVTAILDIVRLHFGLAKLGEDSSLTYTRFVTHVQYFAQRVVNGLVQGVNDAFLYQQVQENYPDAYACTQKIKAYVEETHGFEMSQDEVVYLTIHIQRLSKSN